MFKKVMILHGRDAHRCHHAAAKCILLKKMQDLPSKIVGAFRELAESALRLSPSMGSILHVCMQYFKRPGVIWADVVHMCM